MMNDKTAHNEQLQQLAALGEKFKRQQKGKRPEAFYRYVFDIVKQLDKPTFDNLLYELKLAAIRRRDKGERGEPIEAVNHVWQIVIFHDKKKGRIHKAFGTVRNTLTRVKKELLTASPKQ
jgi:hypothetical protein